MGYVTKLCSTFTDADCAAVSASICRCKCAGQTVASVIAVAQAKHIHFVPSHTVLGDRWHRIKPPPKQYPPANLPPRAAQRTTDSTADIVWAVVAFLAVIATITAVHVYRKIRGPSEDAEDKSSLDPSGSVSA